MLTYRRIVHLADTQLLLLPLMAVLKYFGRGQAAAVLAQEMVDGEGAELWIGGRGRGVVVAGGGLVRLLVTLLDGG